MLIFHVLLILYVLGISRSFFKASVLSPWYPALVMIKVAYAFLYAFIYSYCYIERNDSLCYHHDGVLFNKYFWSAPMQYLKILLYNEFAPTQHPAEFCMWGLERSFFMSKMISVFYILGAQNYW
ncbi:MAG TPA: hypothetical protein VL947_10745, partial [Cytophagales bacterium]|nr:hypothetical protein [Cytophagales bacterium]